jgi:hypothetical protein
MSFDNLRYLVGAVYRLFLLAVMFAVLWMKGYLWWIFGAAAALYVISSVMMHVVMDLSRNAQSAAEVAGPESDDDDYPPMPPTKPFRARSE